MTVIQSSGASVGEPRARVGQLGRPGRDALLEDRGDQQRGQPDQEAAGDQHAHRPEHARRRLVRVPRVVRPGRSQEDRPVHLDEAGHGQRADQGQGRRGEGRAGERPALRRRRACRTGPGR